MPPTSKVAPAGPEKTAPSPDFERDASVKPGGTSNEAKMFDTKPGPVS
jgi:hypothetical protein